MYEIISLLYQIVPKKQQIKSLLLLFIHRFDIFHKPTVQKNFSINLGFMVWLCVGCVFASPPISPLEQRVQTLRKYIADKPQDFAQDFAPNFLQAVPPARMTSILQKYFAQGGKITAIVKTQDRGPYMAGYQFFTEKKMSFPVLIGINPQPPHQINTLWFGLMSASQTSLRERVAELKKLPGHISFALWRLDGRKPMPMHEINPDMPLAIGSTFKLYILGALLAQTASARSHWEQVITLTERARSWPSGVLHNWPIGSPLTLHTLAVQMISISDNTATDHLLDYLGRKGVEDVLEAMGNTHASRNRPFLSTRELFQLKAIGHAASRIKAYLDLDETGRRAYLKQTIAPLNRKEFVGIDLSTPTAIDKVEWFASAADLCRAMDWFRRRTEAGKSNMARHILSINKGLSWNDQIWSYVGYKGGSEPGVLNMTWLAQKTNGHWYALSIGWNHTTQLVDKNKLFPMIQGIILALEDPKPTPSTQPTTPTSRSQTNDKRPVQK